VHAGKVLAILKQLFRFAVGRGYIDQSPAYALDPKDLGVESNMKDRHLDSDEIKALWQVLDSHKRMSLQVRIGLKILLLTGVRTNELLSAEWAEFDFTNHVWNIPEAHSKTNGWTVPLLPAVEDLFLELRDIAGNSPCVMASPKRKKGDTGRISDKALARCLRRLFEPRKDGKVLLEFPKCSPHDFRRTLRTTLDDLKAVDTETGKRYSIEPHVAEKCLNHSLGRIEATCNKNTLLTRRREALQAWADHVDVLVTGRSNVEVLQHG
jgi:integrase